MKRTGIHAHRRVQKEWMDAPIIALLGAGFALQYRPGSHVDDLSVPAPSYQGSSAPLYDLNEPLSVGVRPSSTCSMAAASYAGRPMVSPWSRGETKSRCGVKWRCRPCTEAQRGESQQIDESGADRAGCAYHQGVKLVGKAAHHGVLLDLHV